MKPALAREGLTLDIRVFNDHVQPNTQVEEGDILLNYFQTKPYLDEFNRSPGTHLVTIAGIHVEPMRAYSRKRTSLGQVLDGAVVALPSETVLVTWMRMKSGDRLKPRKGRIVDQVVGDI